MLNSKEKQLVRYIPAELALDSELLTKRVQVQAKYIDELDELYSGPLPVVKLPIQGFEVKGIDALKKIEKLLYPEV